MRDLIFIYEFLPLIIIIINIMTKFLNVCSVLGTLGYLLWFFIFSFSYFVLILQRWTIFQTSYNLKIIKPGSNLNLLISIFYALNNIGYLQTILRCGLQCLHLKHTHIYREHVKYSVGRDKSDSCHQIFPAIKEISISQWRYKNENDEV